MTLRNTNRKGCCVFMPPVLARVATPNFHQNRQTKNAKSSMCFFSSKMPNLSSLSKLTLKKSFPRHPSPSYLPDHGSVAEISPLSWPGMAGCTAQTSMVPSTVTGRFGMCWMVKAPVNYRICQWLQQELLICTIQDAKSNIDFLLDCEESSFDLLRSFKGTFQWFLIPCGDSKTSWEIIALRDKPWKTDWPMAR